MKRGVGADVSSQRTCLASAPDLRAHGRLVNNGRREAREGIRERGRPKVEV